MKRLLSKILGATAIILSLLAFPAAAFAFQPVDQFDVNGLDGWWYINAHSQVGQTFKPTKNRLDAFGVKLNTTSGSASVTGQIWTGDGATQLGSNIIQPVSYVAGGGAIGTWVYYDFSPDLTVTPGATYKIVLTTASSTAYWIVDSTAPTEYGANGNAIVDSSPNATQDFSFITYGYDAAATPPPPPPAIPPPATPPPATPPTSPPSSSTQAPSGVTITQPVNVATTTAGNTDANKATKSAAKATTPTAETQGIFQNMWLWVLLILILIATIAAFFYMKMKKKPEAPKEAKPEPEKAKPEKTETPPSTDTPQT